MQKINRKIVVMLLLISLLLSSWLLTLPPFASAGVWEPPSPCRLWNDNFYVSPAENEWSCSVGGSGIIRNESTQYYSSPYSLHMNSPSGTNSWAYALAPMYKMVGPNSNGTLDAIDYSKNYKVELYFYLPTTNNHWIHVFKNRHIITVIDYGTAFTARWGPNNYLIINLNTSTWYKMTYRVNATAQKYYVDVYNTLLGKNVVTDFIGNFHGGPFGTEPFRLGDDDTSAPASNWGEAYWDNISVYFVPTIVWKPAYADYAPSGVPDFDQKQDNWGKVEEWTYCGPVAVANSLWWLDSANEPVPIPPPTINDHFPLVESYMYGIDDHDPANVQPFVQDLAWLMDTDGQRTSPCTRMGTNVIDMQRGIDAYLEKKGLGDKFYEKTVKMPTFDYIEWEVEKCEDVILLLGFWQWNGAQWVRVGGHFVTVAGIDSLGFRIAFSDPFVDNAELGGPGRVLPPHPPHPGDPMMHNNASIVSHDVYAVTLESPSPGNPTFGIYYEPYYLYDLVYNCQSQNIPDEFVGDTGPFDPGLYVWTEVEYAVIISPWYKKPPYPDYAPSEVPDFCQYQDTWGQPPLYLHTMGLIDLYNPLYTPWHELYPTYCREYYLTSWKHHATLSPSDYIDMTDEYGWVEWFHVDEVTVDIVLTSKDTGITHYMEFTEGLYLFDRSHPVSTWWHELYPYFCRNWHLTSWEDTDGNCLLDYCDQIDMTDEEGWVEYFHVDQVTVTIQLTSYWDGRVHYLEFRDSIDEYDPAKPIGTYWHEVYPDFCRIWTLTSWEDSYMLSPSDQIDMTDMEGKVQWYHVDQITVTLTLNGTVYLDFEGYIGKFNFMNPVCTQWHEIYPVFSNRYHLISWVDNGNGYLDPSDIVKLRNKITGEILTYHVDAVATDLIVTPKVRWTWCGPVAVANSLWWLDSAKELNTIPPPAVVDTYPLVQSYIDGVDDHDKRNVPLFIEDLAWEMDTDGRRTGVPHFGTYISDMQTGIDSYLKKKGLSDKFYEKTIYGEGLSFDLIERELCLCEDVVLLLGFWQYDEITGWRRFGGHYVTVVGVDSKDYYIAISDPFRNNAEDGGMGRVLPLDHPYPHCCLVHNNATFVSHDIYKVALSPSPGGTWGLEDYMISEPLIENFAGQNFPEYELSPYIQGLRVYTEIEFAVIVSCKTGIVIAGSEDKNVYAWDYSGNLLWTTPTMAPVLSVAMDNNGSYVAAGSRLIGSYTGALYFINASNGAILWSKDLLISESYNGGWMGTESKSVDVKYNYYNQCDIVAAAHDGGLNLYDQWGNLIWTYSDEFPETIVRISQDGNYIICADYGGRVPGHTGYAHYFSHLRDGTPGWSSADGTPMWTHYKLDTDGVFWVAISGLGDYVAISGWWVKPNAYITLLNRTGATVWIYTLAKGGYVRVDMPCDGKSVVAVNDDPDDSKGCDLLYFSDGCNGWDPGDGTPVWNFWPGKPSPQVTTDDFYSVAISGNGDVIATGGIPQNVYLLWRDGTPLQTIADGIVQSLDLTFTGEYGVVGDRQNRTWFFRKGVGMLWNYATGGIVHSVAVSKIYPCMFPYPRHDVAVIKVKPRTMVSQGYNCKINVTVANEGDFTETFNVTLFANTTIIKTRSITLTSGNSTTITFTWNTSGFAKGNYTIWAYAELVPNEIDVYDNTYIDGKVWVRWPYDNTGDNYCGVEDIVAVAEHFGTMPGGPPNSLGLYYDPIYDVNCDDYIGIDDIVYTAEHFAQTDP